MKFSDASRIAIAIVLAGIAIASALYLRPIPDRYRFKIAGGQYQRFDTVTGEALFCRGSRCRIRDENGTVLTPVDYDPFANETRNAEYDSFSQLVNGQE